MTAADTILTALAERGQVYASVDAAIAAGALTEQEWAAAFAQQPRRPRGRTGPPVSQETLALRRQLLLELTPQGLTLLDLTERLGLDRTVEAHSLWVWRALNALRAQGLSAFWTIPRVGRNGPCRLYGLTVAGLAEQQRAL